MTYINNMITDGLAFGIPLFIILIVAAIIFVVRNNRKS